MTSPARRIRFATQLATLVGAPLLAGGCGLAGIDRDIEPSTLTGTPGLIGLPSDNPRATRAYLKTLHFPGPPKTSVVACHNGSATIVIYPESRSHLVDPVWATLKGRIVARLVNTGPSSCDDLHLAVGDTAYWWMGSNRGYALTTDIFRIPGAGRVSHLANTGATLVFSEPSRLAPDARISASPIHPVPPGDDDDGDGGVLPLRFGHNSTWIACLGACCESTGLVDAFY